MSANRYSDSNVGLGMVRHKQGCRCDECEMDRLRAELAALRRDAERYRRLLEGPYPFCFEGIMCHSAADVSKAIDAALDRKP